MILTLILSPYKKKFRFVIVCITYCLIVTILSLKARAAYLYGRLLKEPNTNLGYQYFREGWALISVEVVQLVLGSIYMIVLKTGICKSKKRYPHSLQTLRKEPRIYGQ